jgi:hypothetical protein
VTEDRPRIVASVNRGRRASYEPNTHFSRFTIRRSGGDGGGNGDVDLVRRIDRRPRAVMRMFVHARVGHLVLVGAHVAGPTSRKIRDQ